MQAEKIENETAESTELVVISELKSALIFVPNGSDDVLKSIEDRARSMVLDISTDAGRKEVASVAYQIARTKTALDKMGKDLTEDLRKKKDAVDEERRKIRDRLDALKDEIRKPLTEWEDKEKARVKALEDAILMLEQSTVFEFDPTQDHIKERIESTRHIHTSTDWQEFHFRAQNLFDKSLKTLNEKLEARKKLDDEREELERLRAEKAKKEQEEREAKIAAEAAAKAKAEAEEKAAGEAKAAAEKAAAEKAKIEADKKAAEDRALAAEAKAKADAEAAAKAERDKIEAEKKAEADAAAKREADKKHKAKINNEAVDDIMLALGDGYSEDAAKAIVTAIALGKVRNVKITY